MRTDVVCRLLCSPPALHRILLHTFITQCTQTAMAWTGANIYLDEMGLHFLLQREKPSSIELLKCPYHGQCYLPLLWWSYKLGLPVVMCQDTLLSTLYVQTRTQLKLIPQIMCSYITWDAAVHSRTPPKFRQHAILRTMFRLFVAWVYTLYRVWPLSIHFGCV